MCQSTWVDDVKQGHVKYSYPSGDTFECEVVNDIKNGPAVYRFADSEHIRVEFALNAPTSDAVYHFTSGATLSVQWALTGKSGVDDAYSTRAKAYALASKVCCFLKFMVFLYIVVAAKHDVFMPVCVAACCL